MVLGELIEKISLHYLIAGIIRKPEICISTRFQGNISVLQEVGITILLIQTLQEIECSLEINALVLVVNNRFNTLNFMSLKSLKYLL